MTLKPLTLDEYFHLIIKPTQKETTMFEKTKMFFNEQIERCAEKLNTLLTKPVAFVQEDDPLPYEDGYWGFHMYTPEWVNEYGETEKPVHTSFTVPHEGTWMEILDKILDAMEAHYGYNIKEQVYYSVTFPLNDPECAGYTRCLNDELLQQVLLAHPELYQSYIYGNTEQDLFK